MRIPASVYPRGAERDYLRAILNELNPWLDDIKKGVTAVRLDGERFDGVFDSVFDNARISWQGVTTRMMTTIRRVFNTVDANFTRTFERQIEAAETNRRMPSISLRRGMLPFGAVDGLQGQLDDFTRQNTQLIKSIGDDAARNIETLVQDAVSRGASTRELSKLIADQTGIAKRRAATIARDQVGKLNGQISKIRQKSAGMSRYKWQTMEDRGVRPKHAALNGEVRTWEQSPIPGEEILCRCGALPHFTDEDFGL